MSKLGLASKVIILSAMSLTGSAHSEGEAKKGEKIKEKAASSFPNTVKNPQPGEIIVKCAGIVAKGKNHCGANGHPCSGQAAKDFDKNEWIYVRKEVCDATPGRIVGKKKVKKG